MTVLRLLPLTFALGLAGPNLSMAQERCNPGCVGDLQRRGATAFDIQRICCTQQSPNLQLGGVCHTPAGQCGMYVQYPLGSACFCPTGYGPVSGQVGR
jgi:hypothetical protein